MGGGAPAGRSLDEEIEAPVGEEVRSPTASCSSAVRRQDEGIVDAAVAPTEMVLRRRCCSLCEAATIGQQWLLGDAGWCCGGKGSSSAVAQVGGHCTTRDVLGSRPHLPQWPPPLDDVAGVAACCRWLTKQLRALDKEIITCPN